MDKISIIVPSRNEVFMPKTVDDLFVKAREDIEVIVVLDGYWPTEYPKENKNIVYIHRGKALGLREACNAGAALAKGKYLLKIDAHCMFQEGFDVELKKNCDENWIVIPSRYSLDAENWAIENNGKPRRDYHYLCYPDPNKDHDGGMHGVEWWDRGRERLDPKYNIDDTMSFQGSCWFMHKSWFTNFLHGMDSNGYGTFSQEPQEIGNKTWLGGGEIKTNKNLWYAHLHKGKRYGRMYSANDLEIVRGHNYSAWYWMTNQWKERVHDISWLIEKFWPVPTWPENWEKEYYEATKHLPPV